MADLTTNGGRDRAYQELRASEELHRATLSNISDAVFLTNDRNEFTFVRPNVDIIFGYSPDEVRSMSRINGLLGEGLSTTRTFPRATKSEISSARSRPNPARGGRSSFT